MQTNLRVCQSVQWTGTDQPLREWERQTGIGAPDGCVERTFRRLD